MLTIRCKRQNIISFQQRTNRNIDMVNAYTKAHRLLLLHFASHIDDLQHSLFCLFALYFDIDNILSRVRTNGQLTIHHQQLNRYYFAIAAAAVFVLALEAVEGYALKGCNICITIIVAMGAIASSLQGGNGCEIIFAVAAAL